MHEVLNSSIDTDIFLTKKTFGLLIYQILGNRVTGGPEGLVSRVVLSWGFLLRIINIHKRQTLNSEI